MLSSGDLFSEITFTSSRSSGPGGQNVNKVNTRITLRFDVLNSTILSDDQKVRLLQKLSTRLTSSGVLLISFQSKRTQLQNKTAVLERLDKMLVKALAIAKPRKASKPSKGSIQKRLKGKRMLKEKKERRRGDID